MFFSDHFLATSMTNCAQIFTGLLFCGYDGIHQVRRLVFYILPNVHLPFKQITFELFSNASDTDMSTLYVFMWCVNVASLFFMHVDNRYWSSYTCMYVQNGDCFADLVVMLSWIKTFSLVLLVFISKLLLICSITKRHLYSWLACWKLSL